MDEKLQKVLARAGIGSRREMETWIAQGRIKVNGKAATLGDRVTATDRIEVDGRPLSQSRVQAAPRKVVIYHKPLGEVSTRKDPEGRPTVFERLPRAPARGRWVSVGRLDVNTLGLMVFTNDGELANRLMHPSYEVEREYAVRVFGDVTPEILERLQKGVKLDDGWARFEKIGISGGSEEGQNEWYHVLIKEGRRREVRRLWESQGLTVSRLIRVRLGPIRLPKDLGRGESRFLGDAEVRALCEAVKLPHDDEATPKRKVRRSSAHPGGQKRRRAPARGKQGK